MGEIKTKEPVLLVLAVFAAEENVVARACRTLRSLYGPVVLESETLCVDRFTRYYRASMGENLLKRIWAFERLIDPQDLAEIKCRTNRLEEECAQARHALHIVGANDADKATIPARPLNLDPGYLDLGKFVLASTKDHAHRIYLQRGIFAELTLMYTKKRWRALPWTYPDYQSREYHRFLDQARKYLYDTLRAAGDVETD